jgi:MarR family transcriptional regulator, organic hydroperoxide resistance regulator
VAPASTHHCQQAYEKAQRIVNGIGSSAQSASQPPRNRNASRVATAGPPQPALPRHNGLALEVLGKFRQIFRASKLPASSARPAGVTAAELWALWELQRHPGARVSDLTALMSLRQSTVSNLVERLAQARLLTRRRNDRDRRVVRLYLTRTGEKVIGRTTDAARGALPDALERLTAEELRHLDANLSRLLGAMSRRIPALAAPVAAPAS